MTTLIILAMGLTFGLCLVGPVLSIRQISPTWWDVCEFSRMEDMVDEIVLAEEEAQDELADMKARLQEMVLAAREERISGFEETVPARPQKTVVLSGPEEPSFVIVDSEVQEWNESDRFWGDIYQQYEEMSVLEEIEDADEPTADSPAPDLTVNIRRGTCTHGPF